MLEITATGAVATAVIGLLAAIIARCRCRFLIDNDDEEVHWTWGIGFTEIPLPTPQKYEKLDSKKNEEE